MPLDQRAVEWIRSERNERTRRWMVIGPFPNWGGAGHDAVYPPEQDVQLDATYPGWYTAIRWKAWYSRAENGHLVDLQEAFTPVYEYYPRFDNGTGYAYAEFTSERRQEALVALELQDATKVWVNGRLAYAGVVPTNSAYTAYFFGQKNYSLNFSITNLNLIVASYLGPWCANGEYTTTFIIIIAFAIIGMAITFAIRRPAAEI